jgi:hypothetical protein
MSFRTRRHLPYGVGGPARQLVATLLPKSAALEQSCSITGAHLGSRDRALKRRVRVPESQ